MSHLPVNWLKFTYKCLIYSIFFSIFMGATILASAFMVLELGALVIYDGIKNFLTHVQGGGRMSHFTKITLKNSNTLYF